MSDLIITRRRNGARKRRRENVVLAAPVVIALDPPRPPQATRKQPATPTLRPVSGKGRPRVVPPNTRGRGIARFADVRGVVKPISPPAPKPR